MKEARIILKIDQEPAMTSVQTAVQEIRPRLIVGHKQGGTVLALSSFPLILERTCRDRAITQLQLCQFREAWAGVASLLVVDPIISSSMQGDASWETLAKAFPQMCWYQPRGNRRALWTTRGYRVKELADRLGEQMGCCPETANHSRYEVDPDFLAEAVKPLPIYFEVEEPAL